jgi:hypothetical protein
MHRQHHSVPEGVLGVPVPVSPSMTIPVWRARWLSRLPSSMSHSANVCCSPRVALPSMIRMARSTASTTANYSPSSPIPSAGCWSELHGPRCLDAELIEHLAASLSEVDRQISRMPFARLPSSNSTRDVFLREASGGWRQRARRRRGRGENGSFSPGATSAAGVTTRSSRTATVASTAGATSQFGYQRDDPLTLAQRPCNRPTSRRLAATSRLTRLATLALSRP